MNKPLLCFICAVASIGSALAQDAYKFTSLGNFRITSINNHGQIVGLNLDTDRATLWSPNVANGDVGSFYDFSTPGTGFAMATGVNDYGQVIGYYDPDPAEPFDIDIAFLFTPGSPNTTVGSLIDIDPDAPGPATGINSMGQIFFGDGGAFGSGLPNLFTPNDPNGIVGTLAPMPNFEYGTLNDYGQVAGYGYVVAGIFFVPKAGLWTPSEPNGSSGNLVLLPDLNPDGESFATNINSSGQVAGSSDTMLNGGSFFYHHAFLWTPSTANGESGTLVDLDPEPARSSYAYGLNDSGHVVGPYFPTVNGTIEQRAYIYRDGQFIDLNTFVPPNSGIVITVAWDINDKGQIVAAGTLNGVGTAFLLSPRKSDAEVVELKDVIEELVGLGALLPANGQSLYAKLNAAQAKINAGDIAGAIADLQAFINQVRAFVRTGRLSATDGQALIDAANEIITYLQS